MALTTVETAIMGITDRLAYLRGLFRYMAIGGSRFFARVDAAANEVFELRLGQVAHNADLILGNETTGGLMSLQQMDDVKALLNMLGTYARTDLALAGLDVYLTTQGWRLDGKAAAMAGGLSVANIAGDADQGAVCPGQVLGNLTQGGTLAAGTDMSALVCSGSPILARVTVKGATDWTVSTTVKLWDATTKVISQVVAGTGAGGAVGDVYVIGKQAVSVQSVSGQKVVSVAATAQFKAGQRVLLTDWTGTTAPNEVWVAQEIGIIDTIQLNTSLTMLANLKHTYSTDAFVYPIGFGVTAASGSGGNASDRLYYYPAPERRLKV